MSGDNVLGVTGSFAFSFSRRQTDCCGTFLLVVYASLSVAKARSFSSTVAIPKDLEREGQNLGVHKDALQYFCCSHIVKVRHRFKCVKSYHIAEIKNPDS